MIKVLVAAALVAAGCGQSHPEGGLESSAAAAPDPRAYGRVGEGRSSVEPQLPVLDHRWTADDYASATRILERAGATSPRLLPRRDTRVFQRMTSADNLGGLDDPSLAAELRAQQSLRYEPPLRTLLDLYERYQPGAESLTVLALYLELHGRLLGDLDDALALRRATSAGERLRQRERLAALAAARIASAAPYLQGPHACDAAELAAIAPRLGAAIARLRAVVPPAVMDESLRTLKAASDAEPDPRRQAALAALIR